MENWILSWRARDVDRAGLAIRDPSCLPMLLKKINCLPILVAAYPARQHESIQTTDQYLAQGRVKQFGPPKLTSVGLLSSTPATASFAVRTAGRRPAEEAGRGRMPAPIAGGVLPGLPPPPPLRHPRRLAPEPHVPSLAGIQATEPISFSFLFNDDDRKLIF